MDSLSVLIILPLAGSLLLALLPSRRDDLVRSITLGITILIMVCGFRLLSGFDAANPALQMIVKRSWIPSLGASYHLGIDGISILLVLLTVLLGPICVLASFKSVTHQVNPTGSGAKGFHIALLLLEAAILGVFLSLDGLLFFVFWEMMLIPMTILIGIWGSKNRVYAAIKFFIYTMFGGVFLLFGLLAVYFIHFQQTGVLSFAIPDLYNTASPHANLLFLCLALGFAVKVPLWPFHTWLPDAHTEAPTAGSVILAGVLLKMGVYGFLRIAIPVFPAAAVHFAPIIIGLSIIGIIFGGLAAMRQTDVKRLVAYSSVSHLGFVMLGIFSFSRAGMVGGVLQMIIHGINTGLLFLLVGMIYERRHTRELDQLSGLAGVIPRYATVFIIAAMASIALPGTNGFIGEFLCILGGFLYHPAAGLLAAAGVIVSAMYMLKVNQMVIYGKASGENTGLKDLDHREWVVLLPLVILIFWIGFYPGPLLKLIEPAVGLLVK